MEIIYLFLGIAIGALLLFFITKGRNATLSALLDAEKKSHVNTENRMSAMLSKAKEDHEKRIAEIKSEAEQRLADAKSEADKRIAEVKIDAANRRTEELNELRKDYELQLKLFKDNITSTTEQILKQRTEQLQGENSRQMEDLFKPIRDNIQKMEISMNNNRTAHDNNTGKLEKAMQMMMEQAQSIGEKADQLSTALQHKNKVMGNWGELILTNILESQGFTNGKEFDAQLAMRDEEGKVIYNDETGSKMIPDVILHLPDNRDLIIDAKMSLTAFVEYQNAATDAERESAALRHVESVRAHVKELSAKNYSHYVKKPRISCDFVIMFLPHEGAMQLLMEKEPELWNRAFTKYHVYIISGQYLMAAVHMINLSWQHVQQEKNTQEIMKNARLLLERTELFYTRYLTLGKKLEETRKAYDELDTTVKSGNKSIASSGRAFAKLGIPSKGILPEEDE